MWRVWVEEIIQRGRVFWDEATTQPPPRHVASCLTSSTRRLEQHLSILSRSASLALDCVNTTMANFASLRRDWEVFGQRITTCEQNLTAQKRILEAFERDLPPPRNEDVPDPTIYMPNLVDHEHEE